MRFLTEETIARPLVHVYAGLADFEGQEAALAARGVRTRRVPGTEGPEPAWEAEVPFRGKLRRVEVAVTRMTPGIALDYRARGGQIVSDLRFGLRALAPDRTEMTVTLDLFPEGVSGRMLLQSLKLLRPTLVKRFRKRIRDYAHLIERRNLV